MNNIKNTFRDYLLSFSPKVLSEIIDNLELYKLVLHFIKRNGIESFKFSRSEFTYRIFIILQEYRETLLVILENEELTEIQFVSKLSNFILKDMNKHLYRDKKDQLNELKNPNIFSILSFNQKDKLEEEETLKDLILKKSQLKKAIDEEKLFRYREALKSYFGLERPYVLSFNLIVKIFRVKRSTFYFKLKKIKENPIDNT